MNDEFSLIDSILTFEHQEYIEDREVDEEEDGNGFRSNLRQAELREAAYSDKYDTLLAAGTISSSKTIGTAAIITEICMDYPETLVLVVRAKREDLEDKTIPDFMAVLPPGVTHQMNRSKLNMPFTNGSSIMFRSAREQEDRLFSWLKGAKPDILFIDECDGVSREFLAMAESRVGVPRKRSRKDIPKVKPKTFLACNPNISWPKEYRDKYTYKPELMAVDRFYFLKFTVQDNISYITPEKQAQWKRVFTPPMYKRFVEGSWDAISDLEQLFLHEDMLLCQHIIPEKTDFDEKGNATILRWQYYLGVDPAGYGPDKCAFLVMRGPNLHRLDFLPQSLTHEIVFHVKQLMAEYNITPDHVTIDAIGLGSGVCDILGSEHIWVNAHKGSAAPSDAAFYQIDPSDPTSKLNMDNASFSFLNKRAQSHWETMQMMRAGKIGGFGTLGWKDDLNLDEALKQDLAAIHYGFAPRSKAIKIEDKQEIKKRLHRSPDFADVLILAIDALLHDLKKPSMEVFVF